jgi:hypothetical protein
MDGCYNHFVSYPNDTCLSSIGDMSIPGDLYFGDCVTVLSTSDISISGSNDVTILFTVVLFRYFPTGLRYP